MKLNKLIIFVAILVLSGCASFSGKPNTIVSADDEIEILKQWFDSNQILAYFSTPMGERRTQLRNQIVSTRMYAIDLRFSEYSQLLAGELRGSAFGMDSLSILLTGVATVIAPGTATTIIAGADTALKGGRASFNKEILIDQTLPVLLTQMKANRKIIATQIWSGLANRSDIEYSLPLALSQLEDYYQAGTISGALISIGESASLSSSKASKDFESKVLQISYGENQYTKILNEYILAAPNEIEKTRRLKQIQTEIDKEVGVDEIFAPELANTKDPKYLALQKKIVEILKLGGI